MRVHIDIDENDHELLLEILSARLEALRDEVQHTDNRAFRDGLKVDKTKLQELLVRIREAKGQPDTPARLVSAK